MDPKLVQEMSRSADRITEAVRELTVALNRFVEYQEEWYREGKHRWHLGQDYHRPGALLLGLLGAGGLDEEDAVKVAGEVEYRTRQEEVERLAEAEAPSPEEVRERREARRRRES